MPGDNMEIKKGFVFINDKKIMKGFRAKFNIHMTYLTPRVFHLKLY